LEIYRREKLHEERVSTRKRAPNKYLCVSRFKDHLGREWEELYLYGSRADVKAIFRHTP
jgi:hypothetical protein